MSCQVAGDGKTVPARRVSGLEEEGSGIQGEERGVSKKVDFLLENP